MRIGTIIPTHTGPVRITGMVPGGVRTDGTTYSQALTQALANSPAPAQDQTQAATAPGADQNTAANQTADTSGQTPVQSLYLADNTSQNTAPNSGTADTNTGSGGTAAVGGQAPEAKAVSDTPTHWTPSGLAKIAAMYSSTEQRGGGKGAIGTDHLNIMG